MGLNRLRLQTTEPMILRFFLEAPRIIARTKKTQDVWHTAFGNQPHASCLVGWRRTYCVRTTSTAPGFGRATLELSRFSTATLVL